MYSPKEKNIKKLNIYLKEQENINMIIEEYKNEELTNNNK